MSDGTPDRSVSFKGANYRPGRVGFLNPNAPWTDVLEAYYSDKLAVAAKLADEVGLGAGASFLTTYRLIEAEHLTREASVLIDRGGWLLLEFQQPEDRDPTEYESALRELVMVGCDQVTGLFNWSHGPRVLLTMLHPAANVPYVPSRDGYFMDKYPYDKICLPSMLLGSPDRLIAAVRHEYAHAMALNRTEGKCPIWLHEAIAMVAEHGNANVMRPRKWRDQDSLHAAFRGDRNSDGGLALVSDAYAQSFVLGRYLYKLKGGSGLGELLDAFTDNSFGQELLMRVVNQRPEDEALKQVYGMGVTELFEKARSG